VRVDTGLGLAFSRVASEALGAVLSVESDGKSGTSFHRGPSRPSRSRRGCIWTHPVIANGRLYLRDQDLISCHDVKGS
jgi:hypothetical protein